MLAPDEAAFRDHLQSAFETSGLHELDGSWGFQGGYGEGYSFTDELGDPLYFMVRDGSPFRSEDVEWQELAIAGTGPLGGPDWDLRRAYLVVARPDSIGVSADRLREPFDALALATPDRPVRAILYGISPSDVPPGAVVDGRGRVGRYRVLGHEHRVIRSDLEIDLGDPAQEQFIRDTFYPQGVPGLGVDVQDDDSYDAPDFDLGRRYVLLYWNEEIDAHSWVGFVARLADGLGSDLSGERVQLAFSVAGWTVDPDGAPLLYVVLEDVHEGPDGFGNEAHLQIDIGEITSSEQRVSIPLSRFQDANPALDLAKLRHLKFAARDGGLPYSRRGSLALFDLAFVRASPARHSAQNTFWSNDPVSDAAPEPDNPLSDRFLDQPTTLFKYFHGITGAELGAVPSIVTNVEAIVDAGTTPHVTLEMWPAGQQDVLGDIAAGGYDEFFGTLFGELATLGRRVEIAPLHEANGWWYPWSAFGAPERVSDALRRIAGLRDDAAAANVALVYCIAATPGAPGALREAVAAFPGEDAVEIVGLQGFESGYGLDVTTYNEIFATASAILHARAPSLPLAITEYGFYTLPGAQYEKGQLGNWALGDVVALRTPLPPVQMTYFNVAKEENGAWRDWRYYDVDTGDPVPEMVAWAQELEGRARDPSIETESRDRQAYETLLRAHRRTVLELRRGRITDGKHQGQLSPGS